jgi:hypothetical protein
MAELVQEHIDQATAPYTWPHFIIQERIDMMCIKLNLVDRFSKMIADKKIKIIGHVSSGMHISSAAIAALGKHMGQVIIIGDNKDMDGLHRSGFHQADIDEAIHRMNGAQLSDSFKDRIKEMAIELDKMQMECRVVDEVDIQNKQEQKAARKVKQKVVPKNVNYNNKYNVRKQHRLIVRRR